MEKILGSQMDELAKTNGQTITCKAAVAWAAKEPLTVTDIQVAPPKAGEVRVKVLSNALCHTDIYTLDGHDAEGKFPSILGHEAVGLVESVGEGVTDVKMGDLVIPCYTPECGEHDCIFCQSEKTNLCPRIRSTQGSGVMPDGTTRFSKDGKEIFHFMGCSTFSEYTVIAAISAAKISPHCDLSKICVLGCGVSTGWGAVFNTCKVEPGTSVAVYGLGAVGLAVIQAAKLAGAASIAGIDLNSGKFGVAQALGATLCVNPKDHASDDECKKKLMEQHPWGYDYTFDCTGNTRVMRNALELAHRGWGESCVVGVAAAGHEIGTRPFQLITGRVWKGTAFGGWKSRTEVPQLVQQVMRKELDIDPLVTHNFDGLDKVNDSIAALHGGECLRAIVKIADFTPASPQLVVKQLQNDKVFGGMVKRIQHWSDCNQCEMTFSVFIPEPTKRTSPPPPVLYFLSGLTCTDQNAKEKAAVFEHAAKAHIAVVWPDTSARGVDIAGQDDSWDFGSGAGFYLDATTEAYSKHYNMQTYITQELPDVVNQLFRVDIKRAAITGHSMGGHGALSLHFKNPGMYKSVSAFAPISNPTQCNWGIKAFTGYLGSVEAGKAHDATELVATYSGPQAPILVDLCSNDKWVTAEHDQLRAKHFIAACAKAKYPLNHRMQTGYGHNYYFVQTFIGDHVQFHARNLGAAM